MPRISVVVPIYNVEGFLAPCLDSLLAQTRDDFEALLVDDGSTDGSAAIAEAYAARDPRFKLIRQTNGGLSKARNTGIDAAGGEYLSFLDSDDLLPPNAHELLLGSLERTGSDFASGNVERYTRWGVTPARFLQRAFAETREKTHITRDRPLLADRVAWNKLFRRSFWDRHGLRFPEGRVHEDIPVMLPLHFLAKSVDVIAEPVYWYRIREAGEMSITERRADLRVLRDRLTAVQHVSDFLAEHGPRRAKRWYDESVLADDLRLHLDILDLVDDEYRAEFLQGASAFLARAHRKAADALPAILRLKWHLAQRGLLDELLEVLEFQAEELRDTPPVQIRGHWYGDYPFRGDPRLDIPLDVYRLDRELQLRIHLEDMHLVDGRLQLGGFAYINGIGAPAADSQKITMTALRPGRLRRVRRHLTGIRLPTRAVHRPDATSRTRQALADVSWSGFEASLDLGRLRRGARLRTGSWELSAYVRAGGVRRYRARFLFDGPRPFRAVRLDAPEGLEAIVATESDEGALSIDVRSRWALVRSFRRDGDAIELTGELSAKPSAKARLELRPAGGGDPLSYPLQSVEGGKPGAFRASVPLADLPAAEDPRGEHSWEAWVRPGGGPQPLGLPDEAGEETWRAGEAEVTLVPDRAGNATFHAQRPRPVITAARWRDDATLELEGRLPPGRRPRALVVERQNGTERIVLPGGDGAETFSAALALGAVPALDGPRPLRKGRWSLLAELEAPGAVPLTVPVMLAPALLGRLPLSVTAGHKPFALGVNAEGTAVVNVERDLDNDERGAFHQQRLRTKVYGAARREPLRDEVVYLSFQGRQYSDSPRAIHHELLRRNAPLEHLWVVADGRCNVPEGVEVLRESSREFHEALARARYVVTNDHLPRWYKRREGQLCLQTWHGTPFKRLGLDVEQRKLARRRFLNRTHREVVNWSFVLSPSAYATPILRSAYDIGCELLETGLPRTDVLFRADRDALALEIRRRLGVADGRRTVLYAPTYRDHARDRGGRYRLDLHLDMAELQAALGEDMVLLYRKHHNIADPLPDSAGSFLIDVTTYPDATELLLAADVLVTDYSAIMADYANTGRPMLCFAYDLELYRDELRGFYVDFEQTVPGPVVRTTDELIAGLRDLDGVRAAYADRARAFAARFCELDDGRATARVVDRLFGEHAGAAETTQERFA